MTKEKVISAIKEIDEEIKRLEESKKYNKRILIDDFCPHKVGQKVKYVRVQTKRTSNVWTGVKYENTSERDEILVCTKITVPDWDYDGFLYEFKRLKSDGTLTLNLVHVREREVEWLNEYYESPKL